MSSDPTEHYARLDEFRQRARDALTPVRAELAAWYDDFFRRRRGPRSTTHMVLTLVSSGDSPHPRWEFDWFPGMHSRLLLFTPVAPVPEFVAPGDPAVVGLPPADTFSLRQLAFQDVAAEAWGEAGGSAFPKQLLILYWEIEPPDAPPRWVQVVREQIRRHVSGEVPLGARWGLGPPEPLGLPTVSTELIDAVRNGEEHAITAWADAVARSGATEAAELLRWVPRFHAMIAEDVRAVSPQFGFAVILNGSRRGTAWWWIGDCGSEADNDDARTLGRLMAAWNETHPAIEWLLRRLNFPHANVEPLGYATDRLLEPRAYNLSAGEHLEPVPADARVLKLDVPGWEPIEGDIG